MSTAVGGAVEQNQIVWPREAFRAFTSILSTAAPDACQPKTDFVSAVIDRQHQLS
jgi:hypothetical protein